MSTTQLDTRTLLEAVAADLELFQLEKDFQGEAGCSYPHSFNPDECETKPVATAMACNAQYLICEPARVRLARVIERNWIICVGCKRQCAECWKISAL